MSGLTGRLILAYVEREGGREAVDRVLRMTGMTGRERELREEGSWFSFDEKIALWTAAGETLGDPRVALHGGEAALCGARRRCSRDRCARTTPWRAWAARSSRCCCPT